MDVYDFEDNEINLSQTSTETVISIPLDDENDSTIETDIESCPEQFEDEIEINTEYSDIEDNGVEDYEMELELDDNSAPYANPDPLHPILPISNTVRDMEHPDDEGIWLKPEEDDIWDIPPLPLLVPGGVLNMFRDGRQPEDFFETLFDDQMWTLIAEQTNLYASKRKNAFGNCPIEAIDNPNYKKFSRLNQWKDVTESELKVFVAHLLVMGVLKKPELLEHNWCVQNSFFRTLDVTQ